MVSAWWTPTLSWLLGVGMLPLLSRTIQLIIGNGIKVTWVVAVNRVPPVEVMSGTLEKLDEMLGIWWTKMSIEWRKEMLLQQRDLSGLKGWSRANCTSAYALLAEYHDIFLLEPGELGCTGLEKHEIMVVDNEPFERRFWRIPPPMVKEVKAHLKEMLEVGAIHPSQSPRCNTIVLVRMKDGGLHFCIDFCRLNVRTKKSIIHCPTYKSPLKVLEGLGISLAWTQKQVFSRSPWTKQWNGTLPSW